MPPASTAKRPLWATIAIFLLAAGLYLAKQKGWIASNTPAANPSATQSTSGASTPDPTAPKEVIVPQRAQSIPAQSKPSQSAPTPPKQTETTAPKPTTSKPSQSTQAKPTTAPKGTITAAEFDDRHVDSMTARQRAERTPVTLNDLDDLYKQNKNLAWVVGQGRVTRILSDDDEGDKHQRFLMKNADGHEVMVVHNIDLSPRVPLKEGDTITLRGEYIWTDRGGKVHFTHKPKYGSFEAGWIEHNGKTYR